jgi:hypothetical protein
VGGGDELVRAGLGERFWLRFVGPTRARRTWWEVVSGSRYGSDHRRDHPKLTHGSPERKLEPSSQLVDDFHSTARAVTCVEPSIEISRLLLQEVAVFHQIHEGLRHP